MIRLLVPAILFASCCSTVSANEKDVNVDVDVVVQKSKSSAQKSAGVIIINKDGKRTEIQLGNGEVDEKVLKGLPKDVQVRIRKIIEEKSGKGKPVVKTSGKIVIVGDDGRKQVIEFDGKQLDEKVLKGVPKELRIRIEEAMKGERGQATTRTVGKAVIIGPDGRKRVIEFDESKTNGTPLKGLPKEIQIRIEQAMKNRPKNGSYSFSTSGKGTGVFIGPDGKKHEFQMKNGNWTLDKGMLQKMPKDAREMILKTFLNKGVMHKQEIRLPAAGNNQTSDKLDLILKRLENLEKQIQDLRKKVDK